jgi:serine/threonine protein kinase
MGELYRANDSTLNRDVAIKVLPGAFLNDSDRLARFQREAQVLASLNHTNIATIYGVEEQDGFRALVMELVEGPTLTDRIDRCCTSHSLHVSFSPSLPLSFTPGFSLGLRRRVNTAGTVLTVSLFVH